MRSHRLLGYEHELGKLIVEDRVVKVDAFPMGIDYDKFKEIASYPEVEEKDSQKIGRSKNNLIRG